MRNDEQKHQNPTLSAWPPPHGLIEEEPRKSGFMFG
jgi:hypothetical protein